MMMIMMLFLQPRVVMLFLQTCAMMLFLQSRVVMMFLQPHVIDDDIVDVFIAFVLTDVDVSGSSFVL
jgi:hypothetical protein